MRWIALVLVALLAGCADPPTDKMVTVCTEGNCRQQSASTATYDPSTAAPDRDPDGRRAALEALAAQKPSAAYDLALRLFRGDGFPRDTYAGVVWMRKAAEAGDPKAQAALGRLYFTGLEEMGPDLAEAATWLSSAAAAGDKDAARTLAEVRAAQANDLEYQRNIAQWRAATYYWWTRGWTYRWYWQPARGVYAPYGW